MRERRKEGNGVGAGTLEHIIRGWSREGGDETRDPEGEAGADMNQRLE